ncbi:methylated-DNA--[protein]-cysteine S-methyltransferase [Schaalia vaccimaxillae]|uniref:methylated-DNA--[protein]-cysteine S-methyltransferase n=1 Tax=Schaalia vaccimaxillae TaxID=183916 RepID=UPI0003B7050C|nr:methylated-DNA--[protein]-cysteine S-methyltransferase [Schaalia vaccimaxillae]
MPIVRTFYPDSPLGPLTLAGDEDALVGCWFNDQKHFGSGLVNESTPTQSLTVFNEAAAWLDDYFSGGTPSPNDLPLSPVGTDFQQLVWAELKKIPVGETTTYGQLGARVAAKLGTPRMSAQAVGGAVGRNPLSIIVPCHRVVSSSGALTGYSGGIDRKRWLLDHESIHSSREAVSSC